VNVQSLVLQLQADDTFAAHAKDVATRAVAAGEGSDAWQELMNLGMDDVEQANLVQPRGHWTTVTTITSVECLSTTTTTGH
jgi:hypothetical protein